MITAQVYVECEGGFPERFLNEAAARGIPLWDITRREISLFYRCRASDYRALRPAARAASVRMHVVKRWGLPFLLRPFRLRWGAAVGLLLFVAVLQLLSSRVWVVQVRGNERVSEQAIREVLRPLGIYEGTTVAAADIPQLQLSALQQLPDITWLTVNFEGSVATVEVKERQETPPHATGAPANVVASCDGVVLSVDAVTGQAMVKVGDAVTTGTLLISGVMDSKVGPQLKHAEGTVRARTVRTVTVTVPFEETVASPAPRTVTQPCLRFLNWRIPLYTAGEVEGDYTTTTENHLLHADGKELPVGLELTRLTFEDTVVHRRTPEQAQQEAHRRAEEQAASWGDGVTIEGEERSEQQQADGWTVTVRYTCVESIGRCEPLQMHEKTG